MENQEDIASRIQKIKGEKTIVVTSGYFDPLHHGHVELFQKSKELGDHLIVVINNDKQTEMKKGFIFMPAEEKAKIISELRCVNEVFISIDEYTSQCKTLEYLKPHIFAKGGDRYIHEIPETPICKLHGIEIIEGVGAKVQSSSSLIENAKKAEEKLREDN